MDMDMAKRVRVVNMIKYLVHSQFDDNSKFDRLDPPQNPMVIYYLDNDNAGCLKINRKLINSSSSTSSSTTTSTSSTSSGSTSSTSTSNLSVMHLP